MTIEELRACLPTISATGPREGELSGVTDDSREVVENGVFIAVKGAQSDGHKYIDQVLGKGVAAIVAEEPAPEGFEKTWIQVRDTRAAVPVIADLWWGSPSQDLDMIGVTGTNGKTTIAYLVHAILKKVRLRAGMIGTVVVDDGLTETQAKNTTPGAMQLQGLLALMRENGCGGVAMEVSSHGLEQGRTDGVDFNVGIFTNLTQDHLDYHGSMENYFEAKKMLFEQLAKSGDDRVAVVNKDDRWGGELIKSFENRLKIVTYGFSSGSEFCAGKVKQSSRGMEFQLTAKGKEFLVRAPLIGRFNVMNVIAALAAVSALGVGLRDAIAALQDVHVPGRLEMVGTAAGAAVFVDYAHTPDALVSVCQTLRELKPGRLLTVFGCGGDRDRGKRAPMARAVEEYSDISIVTSDNPRSENPEHILSDIEKGFSKASYRIVVDRAEAIREAVLLAQPGDIVLIAGKGHEDYQIVGGQILRFDDRVEARKAIAEQASKEKEAQV